MGPFSRKTAGYAIRCNAPTVPRVGTIAWVEMSELWTSISDTSPKRSMSNSPLLSLSEWLGHVSTRRKSASSRARSI